MDTQCLPTVPFGKYKGQPITTLMNDTKYLEWCKQQNWFQNFPVLYNICVNQTIATTDTNSKTPEHNKLQNRFLNKDNQIKLLNTLLGSNPGAEFKKHFKTLILDEDFINCFGKIEIPQINRSLKYSEIVFEDKYNWDFILYYRDDQDLTFIPNIDTKNFTLKSKWFYDILEKHKFKYELDRYDEQVLRDYEQVLDISLSQEELTIKTVYVASRICCELKPSLGDDYPCVLRKMKTQIELTKNDKHIKKEFIDYDVVFAKYILIIGNFTSKYTTKEELVSIFKQSNIKVIFTHELFEDLKNPQGLIVCENERIQDASADNPLVLEMHQKLLQAEEKIRQLKEEIQLLKTQKQGKHITDYFGKK